METWKQQRNPKMKHNNGFSSRTILLFFLLSCGGTRPRVGNKGLNGRAARRLEPPPESGALLASSACSIQCSALLLIQYGGRGSPAGSWRPAGGNVHNNPRTSCSVHVRCSAKRETKENHKLACIWFTSLEINLFIC